jgi:hypothetical protein
MEVILTKVKELEDALVPNNIPERYNRKGTLLSEPKIGECVVINPGKLSQFNTSTVLEILDDNTFKTYNSIYTITRL